MYRENGCTSINTKTSKYMYRENGCMSIHTKTSK